MGFTPVKRSAGKAMNPPPPATEFNNPPAMAAKNKRMVWCSGTFQCTCWSLDLLHVLHGTLVLQVAGIERLLRLDQHHVDFFFGVRKMFDSVGNDDELPRPDSFRALHPILADAHLQRSLDDEEQFVFPLVMVPDKLALHLCHLYVHIVDLTDDPLVKVVGEERELLGDIYGAHRCSLAQAKQRCRGMKKFHALMKTENAGHQAGISKLILKTQCVVCRSSFSSTRMGSEVGPGGTSFEVWITFTGAASEPGLSRRESSYSL